MIERVAVSAALALVLTVVPAATAHEGHPHKVMGTVSTRHENHLEVKAVDGKTALVTITEKTKIVRGKSRVAAAEIHTGERIVVTARETKGKDGKVTLVATEIRLAEATAGK